MSFWELILLTFVVYCVVYSILNRVCTCIEKCRMSKSVSIIESSKAVSVQKSENEPAGETLESRVDGV